MNKFLSAAVVLFFFHFSSSLSAQNSGAVALHSVQIDPILVVADQAFLVSIVGYNINLGGPVSVPQEDYSVTVEDETITIRHIESTGLCIDPVPPLLSGLPQIREFRVPGVQSGSYTVNVEYELDYFCSIYDLTATSQLRVYDVNMPERRFNLEVPAQGETLSGVGQVQGWACYESYSDSSEGMAPIVSQVQFQLDGGPLIDLPHGGSREDTSVVCGERNTRTGFSSALYWGNFGIGGHEIVLYVEGEEVERRTFTVVAPAGGFMTNIEATYILSDFPKVSESSKIEWSKAKQNFIIVDYDL